MASLPEGSVDEGQLSGRGRYRRHIYRIVLLGDTASAIRRRCRPRSTTTPARSSTGWPRCLPRSAPSRRHRRIAARHDGRVERDPRTQGRQDRVITTQGFRDVLEIRNLRMPRLYDMSWTKPPPLVERRLRVEVDDGSMPRAASTGRSTRTASSAPMRFLVGEGVEAIAVCLLHSYLNPAHEIRVKEIAARLRPASPCAPAPRCCRSSTNTSAPRRRSSTPMSGRSSSAT